MSGRWLLLRRAQALWAVPSEAVRGVRQRGGGAEVELANSSSLQADELLEMTTRLDRRGFPHCVDVPGGVELTGLAVWHGQPVLCIDPTGALPSALLDPPKTADTLAPGELEDADARQ